MTALSTFSIVMSMDRIRHGSLIPLRLFSFSLLTKRVR